MSFFHAFYIISYTATTIGFGEIPNAFSDAQRMWVTFSIYLTVIGWSYSIVTLLALLQDKAFQSALVTARFARRVRRLDEPFYLVCGCGETGGLVCRAMDRIGQRFVVLEISETRVQELDLEDFKTDTPALAADARVPANLLRGGLLHARCRGVLALTDDDNTNLTVAIAVRLLRKDIPVLARSEGPEAAANMAAFGADHVLNPFEIFADSLALAVRAPATLRLCELLTGLPGSELPPVSRPPVGDWVACGYGRFGRAVANRFLEPSGQRFTVVEPDEGEPTGGRGPARPASDAIRLREAGVAEAVGIVAGTDNDANNLAIAMTARQINPRIYVVMRQNHAGNAPLFRASPADYTMVSSEVIAHACLAILTTPLLARFLRLVRAESDAWAAALCGRLAAVCGDVVPSEWSVRLDAAEAPAVHRQLSMGRPIPLAALLRDGADREAALPALALLLVREGESVMLPSDECELMPGDHLLLAGLREAPALRLTS
jgi:Trk K+ transport system NAD-binding subunit